MAISELLSPPIANTSPVQATSVTTASFTPGTILGSLLVALCNMSGGFAFETTPTWSVTDSTGAIWTASTIQQEQEGLAVSQIFTRQLSPSLSPPPPMTVTLAQTANTVNMDMQLAVRVVDGASPNQSTAATANSRGITNTCEVSITPTQTGSWIYLSSAVTASETFSENSNTKTLGFYNDTTNFNAGIVGSQANPAGTTSLQTVSLGWTFSGLPASNATMALEILPL